MKSNFQFSILIVLCVLILTTKVTAQKKQTVLIPKCDTYVICISKDMKNFASDEFLKTKNGTKKFESFIQFEIPQKIFKDKNKISNAKFRIMESGKGIQGNKEFFVAILSENNWDETLCGKIRSELSLGLKETTRTIEKFEKLAGDSDRWYEFDVTEFVKNSPERKLSFRIYNKTKEEDEDSLMFYASEVKGKGPELIIE